LESWSLPIPFTLFLLVVECFYARGWLRLQKTFLHSISFPQLAAFTGGLLSVWIAIASPLALLDHELLSIHMLQHILLMAVAAPLILLGEPTLPLLHGLPKLFDNGILGPCLRWDPMRRVGRFVTQPIFCWIAATLTVIGWHVPAMFELGMRSHWWHAIQQISFFAAGLLFWWPVIQPFPSVSRWPRWSIPLYLFFATLPCDALSAFLTFCDRVVYRPYLLQHHHAFGISPLQDQEWAGVLMWVCITFIYMFPAVVITVRLLSPVNAPSLQRSWIPRHLRRIPASTQCFNQ
jgi:putative membrane protein